MAPPAATTTSRLPPAPGRAASERARPQSMFQVSTDDMRRLQQIGTGKMGPADRDRDREQAGGEDTTRQSKRRSLLPQSFMRKISSDSKEGPIRADTPNSGSDSGTQSEDRAAMPPPPRPRPTSMMRPPSTISARKEPPAHSRLPSKDSVVGPPKSSSSNAKPASASAMTLGTGQTGIKRANSTRQPQSPGPRTSSQQAPNNTGTADSGGSATVQKRSPTSTAQKRSSAVMTKPLALNTALPPSAQTQPSPTSPTRSNQKSRMLAPAKPAFNTYQQHYSPAKSALPKPGIPTTRPTSKPVAGADEANIMNFDVALEQIELLQLSLMHQVALHTLRSYEASAKQKLGKMHTKLQSDYQSIRAQEQKHRRLANLDALETWCPDAALLAEHLQTLGRVVSDLRTHTDHTSRYSELVKVFEEWTVGADSFIMARAPGAICPEALPESWRSQHTSLALNLRSIQRDISMLPPLPPADSSADPSSLHVMMESCSSLVDTMVRELEMMSKIHKEVLRQSKDRIDQQISVLVSTAARQGPDKENWSPTWQI